MATIKPFRGLRPPQSIIEQIVSRPYDVLNSDEARLEAAGNEMSLYHIIRPEIDFPLGTDEHDERVYTKAAENFQKFQEKGWLVVLGEWTKSPKLVSNICLIPGSLVFYMLVSNLLGFIVTVIVMLTFTIWWLRGHLLSAFVVSVASAVSVYAFFSKLMLVPLPAGIFGI